MGMRREVLGSKLKPLTEHAMRGSNKKPGVPCDAEAWFASISHFSPVWLSTSEGRRFDLGIC